MVVGSSTICLVDAHHNGVELALELLFLGLEIGGSSVLVARKPKKDLLGRFFNALLVILGEFILHSLIIELVLHLEAIVLEPVLRLDLSFHCFILILVLLSIGNHLVNFLL